MLCPSVHTILGNVEKMKHIFNNYFKNIGDYKWRRSHLEIKCNKNLGGSET